MEPTDSAEGQAYPLEIDSPAIERADQFEAIKDKFLPLDQYSDLAEEQIHTWHINDWQPTLPRAPDGSFIAKPKRYSDTIACGGEQWRVLLFPYGNDVEHASIYLEHAVEAPSDDWTCNVQFMIVLWNPDDPTIFTLHHAKHTLSARVRDWGFIRFTELRKLFAPQWENKDRPMIEDGKVNLTTFIRVYKGPPWTLPDDYNSKLATGFVGMLNQGATCYLNSLIQSLYFTSSFRQVVYEIATDPKNDSKDTIYALQKLFHQIQTSDQAVTTTDLTEAFGWDPRDLAEQQDVQELSRKLMESLEIKIKGTDAEKALHKMFVGKAKNTISCINVDYQSSRDEVFWDLLLDVRGHRTLDDSFRDYTKAELLDGDNQYSAEGHGLQDAKKQVMFESMPNVLHLVLKRFEFTMHGTMVKVNDRLEFPEVWDATPYLSEDADRSKPWTYRLYGVLVHSGDLNSGHYYAFIRPEKDGSFYRFDDECVTKAPLKEAMDRNFGGKLTGSRGALPQRNPYTGKWDDEPTTNAYMLVYLRECYTDELLLPKEKIQAPLHFETQQVLIAGVPQFSAHQAFDILPWIPDENLKNRPKLYNVPYQKLFSEFVHEVARDFGYDPKKTRTWVFVARVNESIRPDHPIKNPDELIISMVDRGRMYDPNYYLRFWIEEAKAVDEQGNPIWPDNPINPNSDARNIMLFVKHFDIVNQTLQGHSVIYASTTDTAEVFASRVREAMGWEPNTPVKLYEEIKKEMVDEIYPVSAQKTLSSLEISNGDIIAVQRALPPEKITEITALDGCFTADAFYYKLLRQIELTVKPMNVGEGEEKTIVLDGLLKYEQWVQKAAEALGKDPEYLQFFSIDGSLGRERGMVMAGSKLEAAIPALNRRRGSQNDCKGTLFYEEIDVPFSQTHLYKYVQFVHVHEGIQKTDVRYIWVPQDVKLSQIRELVCKKFGIELELARHVRMHEVRASVLMNRLDLELPIGPLTELYFDVAPEDERTVTPEMKELNVYHYERDPTKTHGVPFLFYAHKGEQFKDTKQRLLERSKIPGKEFDRIKFYIVRKVPEYNNYVAKAESIEDDEILYDRLPEDLFGLGLDHPRPRVMNREEIKIR